MTGVQTCAIPICGLLRGRDETARIVRRLERAGCRTLDLSNNEVAKSHVRHMVGGRMGMAPARGTRAPSRELLYRFEFPERQGALMKFLRSMNPSWNISLFHYRNHGADYGRVLAGIQVPETDRAEFRGFLDRLGYDYVDETANPAYRMFLGR